MTVPPEALTERERLGKLVRDTWIAWVREYCPDISGRSSWLTPWEPLDGGQREVDMRIGEAVAAAERDRIRRLALTQASAPLAVQSPVASQALREFADLLDAAP